MHFVNAEDPFDPNDPSFDPMQAFSMLGDLGKMLSGRGSTSWDNAKQIAASIANGLDGEHNVDPADRMAYEALTRVAELNITQVTGLPCSDAAGIMIRPATRSEWANATIDGYRPLLETLGGTLSEVVQQDTPDDLPEAMADPQMAMMGEIMKMIGPMMLSLTAGSMVGHLAQRNLGGYDLPIPRDDTTELLVIHSNLESFTEEWSIPVDDVRLWVCLHELAHHAVLRIPHVRDRLVRLLGDYSKGFRPDPRAIEERFGQFDISDPSSMESMQQAMQDPEAIMGVMQSDEQREILPYISALVAVVEGYVDWVMDQIGTRLIGSYGMLSEAMRRRRIAANPSDRFVARMLGIEVDQVCYERGQNFISGVIERATEDRLPRLWQDEAHLPTPNEVDAPGLWIARTDLEVGPADTDPAPNDDAASDSESDDDPGTD